MHRSSPEFSRAPSVSGFIASIDSSNKYREIFTRRLVAFLPPSALFMLPLLCLMIVCRVSSILCCLSSLSVKFSSDDCSIF